MNESVLIGKAEKFLKEIWQYEIKIDAITDIVRFIEIYTYLNNNLSDLQDFRDTMEIKGYKAPYRSIVKYGRPSSGDMLVEDMHDITRHSQHFRMKAAAKKNILDRVKSSIASHKIALGHLEEFSILRCSNCQSDYKGHEISDIIYKKCSCGSNNLELIQNIHGVYRLEIIKFLPLSGDYMVKMSELSPKAREAFRNIVRILKQEKRGIVKTLSLVVKVLEDGRWVRKRVNLDAIEQVNYEKEIRKQFGSDARIEFMQFHRRRPSIINDKHVQTALALAYVKYAENTAQEIIKPILKSYLKEPDNINIYDDILETSRENALKISDDAEDAKALKKEIMNNKLFKKGLMDNDGRLDHELEKDLALKDKIENCLLVKVPRTLITWDIIKYYLSTSFDHRSKYSGLFPNLRPSLDTNQTKTFNNFEKFVIKIIKKYFHEEIPRITNISELLTGKFEIEKKIKGLHVKTNPPAVGAAILNNIGKISLEESARIFALNPGEVQSEKVKIETFQKPSSRKAQKFLEMIKG
ncbi:MAG: DUF530 domain-containing protein [Methanobacterium sp.]|nr:DUF530 domain-containing protein [Methanobacterium sp.]